MAQQPAAAGQSGPDNWDGRPETALEQSRHTDTLHLYDDLRRGAEELPASKRASLLEQSSPSDNAYAKNQSNLPGQAPRAYDELPYAQELRIREQNEIGIRALNSYRLSSRGGVTSKPPTSDLSRTGRSPAALGFEPRADGGDMSGGSDAEEVRRPIAQYSSASGSQLVTDHTDFTAAIGPTTGVRGRSEQHPKAEEGVEALMLRPSSALSERAEHKHTSVGASPVLHRLSTEGSVGDVQRPSPAGPSPAPRASGGSGLSGPFRPSSMPKQLVAGHAMRGSMLTLARYRPPLPPIPPVRPESLGGVGFISLRPAPPLLFWRLYQRVALNPSPAFDVHFFRAVAPQLASDAPASNVQFVELPGHNASLAFTSVAGNLAQTSLTEGSAFVQDVLEQNNGLESGRSMASMDPSMVLSSQQQSVGTVQQQPSGDNGYNIEVPSGPYTAEGLRTGQVKVQSTSQIVMRVAAIRRTLAGATSFALYVPEVQRRMIRRNARAKADAAAAAGGEKGLTGKAAMTAALASLSWGANSAEWEAEVDGEEGGGTGGLELDPVWEAERKGLAWEPAYLSQASSSQFPALGDAQAQGEEGTALSAEEGGEGIAGLRSHWERNTAFWDVFNLYWETASWRSTCLTTDVEALGRAGGSGVERPGLRMCGCGCGQPWGGHVPFPAYAGGGEVKGHEALSWSGTTAAFVRRALVMRTRDLLVPDAREVSPVGIVANAVFDFSGGWLFDSAVLASLGFRACRLARVLRLSLWHGPSVTPALLLNAILAMPSLQHVHAPGADAWADASLCATLGACPAFKQLRSLDASLSGITDAGLLALTRAAPQLRALYLGGCTNITNAGLLEAGKRCRHLHSLDVSWCSRVDGNGLAGVLSECGSLSRLSARGLGRGYSQQVVGAMPNGQDGRGAGRREEEGDEAARVAAAVGALGPRYHFLLQGTEPVGPGLLGRPFLLHRLAGARVEVLVHLTEVDLEFAHGVTDATVMSLARNGEGALRKLRLGHCTALTAASTTAIALFCPDLTHLSLTGCTGLQSPLVDATIAASLAVQAGLDRAGGVMPDRGGDKGTGWGIIAKLRALDKAGPRQASSAAHPGHSMYADTGCADVHKDGNDCIPPAQWSHLQLADLSGCTQVGEDDIVALITGCPELRDLRLVGLPSIRDATFNVLKGSGGALLGLLKALRLGFQPGVTDDSLAILGQTCPSLACLEIESCTSVSDAGLRVVAESCLHLRELRADCCSDAITLAGILYLAQRCRQLRVLQVGRVLIQDTSPPVPSAHPSASAAQRRAERVLAAAASAKACLPGGSDTSYQGDLFEYILCLGAACPYLEQVDLTGRRPAGAPPKRDGAIAFMQARAKQLFAIDPSSSGTGNDAPIDGSGDGADADADGVGGVHGDGGPGAPSLPASLAEDEILRTGGADAEVFLPRLQRLVLRLAGPLSPRQLQALLATAPALLSADLTDTSGLSTHDVREAVGARQEEGACPSRPYIHMVAQGVPGCQIEDERARLAGLAGGLTPSEDADFVVSSDGEGGGSRSPSPTGPGNLDKPSISTTVKGGGLLAGGPSLLSIGSKVGKGSPPVARSVSQSPSKRLKKEADADEDGDDSAEADLRRRRARSQPPLQAPPPPNDAYPLQGFHKSMPLLPRQPFSGWSRAIPVGTPATPASRLLTAARAVRTCTVGTLHSALFPHWLTDGAKVPSADAMVAGGIPSGTAKDLSASLALSLSKAPSPPRTLALAHAGAPQVVAAAPPGIPQQLTPAAEQALRDAAGDTLCLTLPLLRMTLPPAMLAARQLAQHQVPQQAVRALGFDPLPGACFARASVLVAKRLAAERIAANRIRMLVRHGLRIEKVWFWTLIWRVRVHIAARIQFAARRIQRVWRAFFAWLTAHRLEAAIAMQRFWRRMQFIDRVRRRVLAALQARRAAATKQLAVSLMAHTVNRALSRQTWDLLRLNALIERWKDERRINRLRGLGPVYGHDGRLKVQFALPVGGPEILGIKEQAMEEANAMEIIIRANMSRPLSALAKFAARGVARPTSARTVESLVSEALGRSVASRSMALSQSSLHSTAQESQSHIHTHRSEAEEAAAEAGDEGIGGWEFAYAYRFQGLTLADPRRVRRRVSWVRRRDARRKAIEEAKAAEVAAAAALVNHDKLAGSARDAAMQRLGGFKTFDQVQADLAEIRASKGDPRPGTPGPLPTRPHRPRRNSFDLVQLAAGDPDTPEYGDGWESYDSADEPENRAFLEEERSVSSVFGTGGVLYGPEAGVDGGKHRRRSATVFAPAAIGTHETKLLLDSAAEDEQVNADALADAARTFSNAMPSASKNEKDGTPYPSLYSAYPPQSQQGGRRPIDVESLAASIPAWRPESVYARRVAHARDHSLSKLGRLHVALRQTRNAISQMRTQLEAEAITEHELRATRDTYERQHGEGSSKTVAAWAELDARNRDRVAHMFTAENRASALEEEIRLCAAALKASERKVLAARRQREIRQIAVATARAGDPSMLVLDAGSRHYRLADDSGPRLAALYGEQQEVVGRRQEKKVMDTVDEDENGGEGVDDGGVLVSLNVLANVKGSPGKGGKAAKADSKTGPYGTDVTLSVVGFRKGHPRAEEKEEGSGRPVVKVDVNGDMVDPRDMRAVAVMQGTGKPPLGHALGLRATAAAALLSFTERPTSGGRGKLLPIRHSPYVVRPGKVNVVLPNPDGVGGQATPDFGTSEFKRTALSRVLATMGLNTQTLMNTASEAALGGFLGPLALAARPLESLVGILGPLAFIQASKRRLPIELRQYCAEKKVLADNRREIELGAQRRVRYGLIRRIQRSYRTHLVRILIARELGNVGGRTAEAQLIEDRISGRADPVNCASAPRDLLRSAVAIQTHYRCFSARIFFLRAKRAQAVAKASELLAQLGEALAGAGAIAMPATSRSAGSGYQSGRGSDPAEMSRAYVLAGQVQQQLSAERKATGRMRRASALFDKEMAGRAQEFDEAGAVLARLGGAIASGAEIIEGPSAEEEFSAFQSTFSSGGGFAADDFVRRGGLGSASEDALSPGGSGMTGRSGTRARAGGRAQDRDEPLLKAYRELSKLMSMDLGVDERRNKLGITVGKPGLKGGASFRQKPKPGSEAAANKTGPVPMLVLQPVVAGASGPGTAGAVSYLGADTSAASGAVVSVVSAGPRPRRASYYAEFATRTEEGFQGTSGWVFGGRELDEGVDAIDIPDEREAGEQNDKGRVENDSSAALARPPRLNLRAHASLSRDGSATSLVSMGQESQGGQAPPPPPLKAHPGKPILKQPSVKGKNLLGKGVDVSDADGKGNGLSRAGAVSQSRDASAAGSGSGDEATSGSDTASASPKASSVGSASGVLSRLKSVRSMRSLGGGGANGSPAKGSTDAPSGGGATRKSNKSNTSREARRRAALKASEDTDRKERYYRGRMSMAELVAYRRLLDAAAFMARLEAIHDRAVEQESWLRGWASEFLPCLSEDMVFRYSMLGADAHEWSRHWGKVNEYMAVQVESMPALTDPLILLRKARLAYRMSLLGAVLDIRREQAVESEGTASIFRRVHGWADRMAYNLLMRSKKDSAVVRRVKKQLPSAVKALAFLDRRCFQLSSALTAWKEGSSAHRKKAAWKAADVMREVVSQRDVEMFQISMGTDGEGEDGGSESRSETASAASPSPRRRSRRGVEEGGTPRSRERDGEGGSATEDGEDEDRGSARGSATSHETFTMGPSWITKQAYDWRATDEWVVRQVAGSRKEAYTHLPTGFVSAVEPKGPPPGWLSPEAQPGGQGGVNPAFLPTLVGTDEPAPPVLTSPSNVPTRLKETGQGSTAPGDLPSAIRSARGAAGVGLPAPLQLNEADVLATIDPVTGRVIPAVVNATPRVAASSIRPGEIAATVAAGDKKSPKSSGSNKDKDSGKGKDKRSGGSKGGSGSDTGREDNDSVGASKKPKSMGSGVSAAGLKDGKGESSAKSEASDTEGEDEGNDTVTAETPAAGGEISGVDIAAAIARSRAIAKKGGFDVEDARAELWWVTNEAVLLRAAIARMESYLRAVYQQHAARATAEMADAESLRATFAELDTLRGDERRAQTELVQVRQEVASQQYHAANAEVLDRLARLTAASFPRFGRLSALPPHPRDLASREVGEGGRGLGKVEGARSDSIEDVIAKRLNRRKAQKRRLAAREAKLAARKEEAKKLLEAGTSKAQRQMNVMSKVGRLSKMVKEQSPLVEAEERAKAQAAKAQARAGNVGAAAKGVDLADPNLVRVKRQRKIRRLSDLDRKEERREALREADQRRTRELQDVQDEAAAYDAIISSVAVDKKKLARLVDQADAKRNAVKAEKKERKGWFGGLFGGKGKVQGDGEGRGPSASSRSVSLPPAVRRDGGLRVSGQIGAGEGALRQMSRQVSFDLLPADDGADSSSPAPAPSSTSVSANASDDGGRGGGGGLSLASGAPPPPTLKKRRSRKDVQSEGEAEHSSSSRSITSLANTGKKGSFKFIDPDLVPLPTAPVLVGGAKPGSAADSMTGWLAKKAARVEKRASERDLRRQQSFKAQDRYAVQANGHVDFVVPVAAVDPLVPTLSRAGPAAADNVHVKIKSSTQYVDGGAIISGYTYGVRKNGRFGRHIKKPSDVAREEMACTMTEREVQAELLAHQAGLAELTQAVADKTQAAGLKKLSSADEEYDGEDEEEGEETGDTLDAFGHVVHRKPRINLAEWHIPPRRPPTVRPTPSNLAYYSIAGDGEEIGNPGFWYWGRDKGTVTCLFGVKLRVEPIGGYASGEKSGSDGSDSDTDDETKTGVKITSLLAHGRAMAALRADTLRKKRAARKARRLGAMLRRLEGREGPLVMGMSKAEAAAKAGSAASGGAMGGLGSVYESLVAKDEETLRRDAVAAEDKKRHEDEGEGDAALQFEARDSESIFKAQEKAKKDKAKARKKAKDAELARLRNGGRARVNEGVGGASIDDASMGVGRQLEVEEEQSDGKEANMWRNSARRDSGDSAYEDAGDGEGPSVESKEGRQGRSLVHYRMAVKKDAYWRLGEGEDDMVDPTALALVTVPAAWARFANAAGMDHVLSQEEVDAREKAAADSVAEAARKLEADNEERAKKARELRHLNGEYSDSDESWGSDGGFAADLDSDADLLTTSDDDETTRDVKRNKRLVKAAGIAADAADTPHWWAAIGLDDEEALMASRGEGSDPELVRLYRGFGGGVLCARSGEEYASRLAAHEYKARSRLSEVASRRMIAQNRIEVLMASLEKASEPGDWKPYTVPPNVAKLIESSIEATDAPKKMEWEEEQEVRAKERKAAKDVVEYDRLKRLGMSDGEIKEAEVSKAKLEEEMKVELRKEQKKDIAAEMGLSEDNPAHTAAIDAALTMAVAAEEAAKKEEELAAFRLVRASDAFRSGGFRGIVAPDGALLEWAGEGTSFLIEPWKARYRVKPWVVDSAILRFMSSQQGKAILTEADMTAALLSEGAQAMIRAYKVGGADLPLSGFEAARVAMSNKKEAAALEAAAKAADAAKAEADRLRKSIADRNAKLAKSDKGKGKNARKKKEEDEKARKAAAKMKATKAADEAKDQMQRITRAVRNLMLNVQKGIAEYRLKRNKALQGTVASVRKFATAAMGAIEGIVDVAFTFGVFADADFAGAQRVAYEKGDALNHPFFLKLQYNLSSVADEPVYLWTAKTNDIQQMITHLVWAPTATDDPTASLLHSKGYKFVTHPALFPQIGLWFQKGSGKPVTAITATFDSAQTRLMEQKGFKSIDGIFKSDYVGPNVKFWYRTGRQKKRNAKATAETVRDTENGAMEAKILYMETKIALSKEAKKGKGGAENQTLQEGLARAKAEYAAKRKDTEALREENLQRAAIDFLVLKDNDVTALRKAYERMDSNGGGNSDGETDLSEFFEYCDVERTPLADSVFFFLDGSFSGDVLTFGVFLRTVCSFCMFGSKELVGWVFAAVASNVVAKAEALHDPPKPGRAGARGQDRKRNRSVYWENAIAWSTIPSRDPAAGRMSVKAFAQLLYSIHAPTSALALTVKRSIDKAKEISVGDDIRLFQFRALANDFPTLLSPLFLMQTRMRQKFMGEAWWASKRQLFSDARDVVNGQLAIETRLALLAREETRAKNLKTAAENAKGEEKR